MRNPKRGCSARKATAAAVGLQVHEIFFGWLDFRAVSPAKLPLGHSYHIPCIIGHRFFEKFYVCEWKYHLYVLVELVACV
jgi:hypothetical protein